MVLSLSAAVVSFDESTGGSGVAISVSEGIGTLEVVLVLSKAVGQEVSVFVITTEGSARADVDFGPSENYTVTFPAGSTRQSVEIPIIDNNVYELNRDFQFRLDVPEVAVRAGVIDGCDPFTNGRFVQIIDDDLITVMFNQTMYSVIESAGPARPVLVLSNPSSIAFDVTVTNTNGSAFGGDVDYGSGPYTVTFPAGMTSVPFNIPITDDIVFEGDENFMLTIDPSLATFVSVGTPDEATVTIVDDDPITVMFSETMYGVAEDFGPAQPVLVLSNPSATSFDVTVTNIDGSATGGDVDYGSGPYTVRFLAGMTSVPFDIPITDDNVYEGNEDFILTIDSSSLPTGGSVGTPGQATVTIVDDAIAIMFNKNMYSVNEGAGPAQPVLVLSGPSATSFDVMVTKTDGSATGGGVDYGSGPYTVTFPAGVTSVPFDIPIIDDNVFECNENFTLTIDPSLPTGGSVGTPGQSTVTIVDDDPITVMFRKTMYNVTEGAGPAKPVLVLSGPSSMAITVTVTSTDGSATGGGVDYNSGPYTVTFPAGMTRVPFDIPINNDDIYEINENLTLTIDPSLPTGVSVGTPGQATVTIVDDDPITVMFSETMYNVTESDVTESAGPVQPVLVLTFTISFEQPTYNVNESDGPTQSVLILSNPSSTAFDATVTNTDGSATGGDVDYGSGPYTVTFPAGVTSVSFDISITDDNLFEGNENFILTIDPSSLLSVGSVVIPSQAIVTIVDNDATTVMFSERAYRVDENDGPAQPVLVFSNPPLIDITIQVRDDDDTATSGDDYGPGIYTVVIPAETSMVPFNISIVDDNILEGDEDFDVVILQRSLPAGVIRGNPRATVTIVNHNLSLPKFSKQPDDMNVTVYNSASFVCTARGYGLVKIIWKRVNYTLPITAVVTQEESLNQITSTLKISEIIGYYSGQYYCVAANNDVEVTSQIVNLHVTKIRHPEMIISFENITVLPNQDVHFSCLASSLGVLTYDWNKRDGNMSQNVFKSYTHKNFYYSLGSENTLHYDLAIHNVQPLNEGLYCCTATNEAGNTTQCIWLEVNTLPTITMQPASETFKARDLNVTAVSCKAIGIEPIYYRWEKYHSMNNSWIRPSHRAISVTSPNLRFKIITEEDEGTYHCIVTNDDGDVISDNATVYVYGPPIIILISNSTVSLEGDKINLHCTVINDVHANYSIQVNWYKGNKLIKPEGERILLYNESTKDSMQLKSILTLDPVIPNDDGLYTCRAFNHPDLYSESNTNLTIEYAPRVSLSEQSPYIINVGSVEIVYCRADGKPIPTVQWYKGDTPVTPLSSNFLLVPTDSPHTTVYICEGVNYAGNKKHVGFANITIIVKVVKSCLPLLEAPENGKRHFISPRENGLVKYISFSCNSSYVLKGHPLATCINGTWSSSTPVCIKQL